METRQSRINDDDDDDEELSLREERREDLTLYLATTNFFSNSSFNMLYL